MSRGGRKILKEQGGGLESMSKSRPFKRVAVVMGGPSQEREVSLRSGRAVAKGLRESGYEVEEVNLADSTLSLPPGIEAVFIALHGEFGEDGQVQAQLDRIGMPYTGSGAEASRASFDKVIAKRLMVEHGVPTPAYQVLENGDTCTLPLPLVLKPACQGSSLGVHRVFSPDQWEDALRDARTYDDQIIAETYIPGRELTVGVVGDEVLPVVEIEAPDAWYSYAAKYTVGACRYRAPAQLPEAIARRSQSIAIDTFHALGCRGLGRIDFRLADDGALYVLELNNIPGFTETSLLPKAAACAGIGFAELCDRIMRMARLS